MLQLILLKCLTSSIGEAHVREAPNISQANSVAQTGQDKLSWVGPRVPCGLVSILWGCHVTLSLSSLSTQTDHNCNKQMKVGLLFWPAFLFFLLRL